MPFEDDGRGGLAKQVGTEILIRSDQKVIETTVAVPVEKVGTKR